MFYCNPRRQERPPLSSKERLSQSRANVTTTSAQAVLAQKDLATDGSVQDAGDQIQCNQCSRDSSLAWTDPSQQDGQVSATSKWHGEKW